MAEQDLLGFGTFLLQTKGLMSKTVELYLGYYKGLDIARIEDQEYVNQFVQDHKNSSVVRAFLLNYLQYKGLSKKIDLPMRKTGSEKKRIIRDIDYEEISKLKNFLYEKSFKRGLIFDILYSGALRRIEVPTIKLNSFLWKEWLNNMDGFCKLIVLGKGNKERPVLVNPETAKKILDFYNKNNSFATLEDLERFINSEKLLFSKKNGDPITEKQIYDIVKFGSLKCLGRDIRTHELRHCRASELEKMGLSPREIQTYLGHVNLATTEIYLHKNEKDNLNRIEKVLTKKELKPKEDY